MSTGIEQAIGALEDLGADLANPAGINARIADQGAALLAGNMPVRTGALRASARGEVIGATAVISAGGPRVDYAAAVDSRVNFTGRTAPALEQLAYAEYEFGVDDLTRKHGLQ